MLDQNPQQKGPRQTAIATAQTIPELAANILSVLGLKLEPPVQDAGGHGRHPQEVSEP